MRLNRVAPRPMANCPPAVKEEARQRWLAGSLATGACKSGQLQCLSEQRYHYRVHCRPLASSRSLYDVFHPRSVSRLTGAVRSLPQADSAPSSLTGCLRMTNPAPPPDTGACLFVIRFTPLHDSCRLLRKLLVTVLNKGSHSFRD